MDADLWQDKRTRDPAVRRAANECLRAWEVEHGERLRPASHSGAGTVFTSSRFLVVGRTSRIDSLQRNPGLVHWSSISEAQFGKLKRHARREKRRLVLLLLSHEAGATRYFEVDGERVEWERLPKRPSGGAYLKVYELGADRFLELERSRLDVTGSERRVVHPISPPPPPPRPPKASYAGLITIDPRVRSGKACIRGLRITVQDVLEYLASGMTPEEVLADFPELTPEDIRACLAFAADRERRLRGTVV